VHNFYYHSTGVEQRACVDVHGPTCVFLSDLNTLTVTCGNIALFPSASGVGRVAPQNAPIINRRISAVILWEIIRVCSVIRVGVWILAGPHLTDTPTSRTRPSSIVGLGSRVALVSW
jgi:hypothetical protein